MDPLFLGLQFHWAKLFLKEAATAISQIIVEGDSIDLLSVALLFSTQNRVKVVFTSGNKII